MNVREKPGHWPGFLLPARCGEACGRQKRGALAGQARIAYKVPMSADIPENLGKRVGELRNLPEELREQLVVGKRDELEEVLTQALGELEGIANLDELLVAVYRATGKVYKRTFVSNKMYRMAQNGMVESVPKRKGVYRLPEPKRTWGRYEM